jgi:hypothetical protein
MYVCILPRKNYKSVELLRPKNPLIAGILINPKLDSYQDGMEGQALALCTAITSTSESETPEQAIPLIEQFVKDHGKSPWNLCFAFEAYMFIGEESRAEEVINAAHKEFPEDLLVLSQMGMLYIQTGNTENIPSLFGQHRDLNTLYPQGTTFSIKAVHNWAFVLGGYFVFSDDFESAQQYLIALQEISPEHDATQQLEELIADAQEFDEMITDCDDEDCDDEECGDEEFCELDEDYEYEEEDEDEEDNKADA